MTPEHWLSREHFGNGVRYRVAACRRRLRIVRATHRTQILPLDEEIQQIGTSRTDIDACRKSENPAAAQVEPGQCTNVPRPLLLTVPEEQEAGIT
jgi:hypothetical protein